jgi:hypothetical protein
LSQDNDLLSQDNDLLSQDNDLLSQDNEALSQDNDLLSQDNEALSQDNEALSQDNEALSQDNEALSQDNEALPQDNGLLSQDNEALPQDNGPYYAQNMRKRIPRGLWGGFMEGNGNHGTVTPVNRAFLRLPRAPERVTGAGPRSRPVPPDSAGAARGSILDHARYRGPSYSFPVFPGNEQKTFGSPA